MKKSVEFSVGKKESTDREGGWGEKGEKKKKKKKKDTMDTHRAYETFLVPFRTHCAYCNVRYR